MEHTKSDKERVVENIEKTQDWICATITNG